jgi:hypothetical protein
MQQIQGVKAEGGSTRDKDRIYLPEDEEYLVTPLVPSLMACLESSPVDKVRDASART